MQSLSDIRLRRKRTRKRLVMSQRRYEDACNRIADANVTFGDKGGAALYRLLRHGRCEHFRYRLRRKALSSQKGGSDSETSRARLQASS